MLPNYFNNVVPWCMCSIISMAQGQDAGEWQLLYHGTWAFTMETFVSFATVCCLHVSFYSYARSSQKLAFLNAAKMYRHWKMSVNISAFLSLPKPQRSHSIVLSIKAYVILTTIQLSFLENYIKLTVSGYISSISRIPFRGDLELYLSKAESSIRCWSKFILEISTDEPTFFMFLPVN